MSYTQISLEKKKTITGRIAFIAAQFAIIFLGVMVGLWVVTLIRISEVETNSQIALVRILAIVFTALTAVATILTIVSYLLYIKYKNLLDGFVDQSLKSIQKEKVDVSKKQNINIKLTAPAVPAAAPVTNTTKTVQNGPVKKVVTTTTTTTSKPGTVVRTINAIPAKSKTSGAKPMFSGLKSMFKKPADAKVSPTDSAAAKTAVKTPAERPVVGGVKPPVKAPGTRPVVGAKPVAATPRVAPVRPSVAATSKPKVGVSKPAVGSRPVAGSPRPVMPIRPGVAPAARR
ncbi:hypothetical protein [Malacoplasma muris]|uniref:hypothetical protein n=1 Tax=Malacoplasma muris TaxID=2119 RepID=UPI00398E7C51